MRKQAKGTVMAVAMVMALSGCGEKIAADNPKLISGQNVETTMVKQLTMADFVGNYELKEFSVSDKDDRLLLASSSISGWSGSSTIDSSGKITQFLYIPPSTVIYSSATMSLKDSQTIHFINDSGNESDVQFTLTNNIFTTTAVTSLGKEKNIWVRPSTTVAAKELDSSVMLLTETASLGRSLIGK